MLDLPTFEFPSSTIFISWGFIILYERMLVGVWNGFYLVKFKLCFEVFFRIIEKILVVNLVRLN